MTGTTERTQRGRLIHRRQGDGVSPAVVASRISGFAGKRVMWDYVRYSLGRTQREVDGHGEGSASRDASDHSDDLL
jgi:hypothetical protein